MAQFAFARLTDPATIARLIRIAAHDVDVNGTLIESAEAHDEAFHEALGRLIARELTLSKEKRREMYAKRFTVHVDAEAPAPRAQASAASAAEAII